ncbi:MAG TPA: hypothetical protein VIN37_01760 [Candidatus Limnocylindria bacterium]
MKTTARIHPTLSTPAIAATGTDPTAAMLRMSVTIMSRRRSVRSVHAPMSKPNRRCGTVNSAALAAR